MTWQNGAITPLSQPPGAQNVRALSINDNGQIVGVADGRAMLWQNGALIGLPVFRSDQYAEARAINNLGQILGMGMSGTSGAYERALLWNSNPNAKVLVNGGFEADADRDDKPDGWSYNPLASRSNAARRSGSYSLRLQAKGNRDFSVWQPVYGVRPDTTYDVAGWANIPVTGDQFSFTIVVAWKDKVGNELRVDTVKRWSSPTNGWSQASKVLVSPPRTDRATVRLVTTSLAATVYVDDVLFRMR